MKKVITVLIAAMNMNILNRLEQKARRTLPPPVQFKKEMRIESVKDIIKKGKTDIFLIGKELSDDTSDDLIKLIDELYPEHPIIFHSENEDIHYEWNLYNRYDNIKCVTRGKLFRELEQPLLRAYKKVDKHNRHRFVFSNTTGTLDELCYVKPANGGMLEYRFYDWKTKKFRSAYKKTTIKKFVEANNDDGDIVHCHASYAVPLRMIKRVNRKDRCLVLEAEDENEYPVEIPIGGAYYTTVLAQTKGLY
jgi:hypothetical protein